MQNGLPIEPLWERMWASGVANPVAILERISYLLYLRLLDLRANSNEDLFLQHPSLRWENLRESTDEALLASLEVELIPFLVDATPSHDFSEMISEVAFTMPTARLARQCFDEIDRLSLHSPDQFGAVYSALLDALPLSGSGAQFRTPRPLVDAMIGLVDPRPGESICDPAAGTGSFLVEVQRRMSIDGEGKLLGFDIDPAMVRLGLMNLVLHGVDCPRFSRVDSLSRSFEWPAVEVVISNPPFGALLESSEPHPDLDLETRRSELLFLELCRHLLWRGGRAAIVLPEGVLFGGSVSHRVSRRRWLTEASVHAVISLPASLFQPHSGVRTAVLFATAAGATEEVWFGSIDPDDFAERTGPPTGVDALKDLAAGVKARIAGDISVPGGAQAVARGMWSATIDKIAERDWSLAPSSYRRQAQQAPEEEDPAQLLKLIARLDDEIRAEIGSMRSILDQDP